MRVRIYSGKRPSTVLLTIGWSFKRHTGGTVNLLVNGAEGPDGSIPILSYQYRTFRLEGVQTIDLEMKDRNEAFEGHYCISVSLQQALKG